MCFSKEASIIAFVTGIVGSALCISLGTIFDKIIGYFVLFVSSMQGIEYLLWRHPYCDEYNKQISTIGMILNHLQPIVFGMIILFFTTRPTAWIWFVLFIYLCVIVPYSIQWLTSNKCTVKREHHLFWKWNRMEGSAFIYVVFLLAMCLLGLLGFPTRIQGVYFAIIACITYISSSVFYTHQFVGPIWCYYTTFLPVIYYICRRLSI
jgi:hypothetical protein